MTAHGKLIDPKQLLRPTLKRMNRSERLEFSANHQLRQSALWAKARALELTARQRSQRFRCRALSGESSYNIAINADLSVSCNCDDVLGEGRLGSLRDGSLSEVLRGPKAAYLREALAAGRLPVNRCASCPELEPVPETEAARWVHDFKDPTAGVMLETNANCNLSCIACYRALRPLERLKMRIEDVRRVARELATMGVQQVAFFTLGEPFMSNNLLEEMQVLREEHPSLRILTSTNGVLVDSDTKRRAALAMDHVTFSIDGCDQSTAERYQVGTNFEAAYRNMCELVAFRDRSTDLPHRTVIEWKYVVFRWNDRREHIARALELAQQAGVDQLSFWHTLNPVHGVSTRFYTADYFKHLGTRSGKVRRVMLREARAA